MNELKTSGNALDNKLIPVKDFALKKGITVQAVYQGIKSGLYQSVKFGSYTLVKV
jgi:hypothetical protein